MAGTAIDIPEHAKVSRQVVDDVADYVDRAPRGEPFRPQPSPLWQAAREAGSRLWLDSGDEEAIADLWTTEFEALTTNNTLLNKEVQKGLYDRQVAEIARLLEGVDRRVAVLEIAFALNAMHGLRLVHRFGAKVSVELHTDLAHDVERSVFYGRRYHAIAPDDFIVKVPLTAAGLIACRRLRRDGVPVNFTLGFSARQNHLAVRFAMPNFVNVFLGRLNSYVSDQGLGDGANVGEKAALASQRATREAGHDLSVPTLQIAASMRSGDQVAGLAGVDVLTMPTKVAAQARDALQPGDLRDRTGEDYPVRFAEGVVRDLRPEVLWEVDDATRGLADALVADPTGDPDELVRRAHDLGAGDLLPRFADDDLAAIRRDGKIPDHARWRSSLARREVALDSLMNQAGLFAFATDQEALDDRIREHMG